jgi:class 3 adenylate cyclase/tetratricopeptide (TPR) repeat protein
VTDVVNNASEAGHGSVTSASPVRVFLSYRRDDVPDAADRLAESLARRFGKSQVFLDIDKIDIGAPFAKIVGDWVASCDVLLALIGRGWVDATNDDGYRRLADPNDYVRLEIEAALSRDIRVVPVLIHGATIPKDTQLPASLVPLLERNAIELNRKYWDQDVEGLADAIERIASERSNSAAAKPASMPVQPDPVPGAVPGEPRPITDESQREPRPPRASAPATAAVETVHVLMTDLVGSTALAERVGPAAADELRVEHFALLRDALERTGGREVKNLGDGLMVVFASAAASLACAVQMQQAMETRNRRAKERLGLRIGVSVGDATVQGGDYFGEPVVQAARLCAHAEGGQVVVNALVRQLSGAREGHTFRPLGGLALKGINEPVEAFELLWEPAVAAIALPDRLREQPSGGYVGRATELERLQGIWEKACVGPLQLVLIGGEAGVGKTGLSTQLARRAHLEGAAVLYGRCDEDLGVPYQPWTQALDHLVKAVPESLLDAHVGRFGGDLVRLVPALRERVCDLPPAHESDPETERYLMYAAVAGLLEQAAEQESLMLILDDLHWADTPTLSLLRYVATSSSSIRAMLVATYRDSDVSRDHPLPALLATLHGEQAVERMELRGLDAEDVAALMQTATGLELADRRALASGITRETAGNPFFANEVLRHLTESGAFVQDADGRWRLDGDLGDLGLSQGVREVIAQRVERLGPDARAVLSAAAVIGRDFDLDLLLAVVEMPEAQVIDLLEKTVAASLLRESTQAERFTFTHALVAHALYADLGLARRTRLHKRIAQALERQCGDEPGERLGELANHWAAATVSADTGKAIHYAQSAAERALAQLAPDEALRWYRQALDLHRHAAGEDGVQLCELLIGLGEAERQTGSSGFRQTLLDAASVAQKLGDSDCLCRAVLANSRGFLSQSLAVDSERVHALEAAAAALGDDDSRRARVLALLASELHVAGDPARCQALAAEAIEIARAAGDADVLAHTLVGAFLAIWIPDTLEQRRRLIDDLVQIAARLTDPRLRFWGGLGSIAAGMEAGDRAQVESGIEQIRAVADSVPEPTFTFTKLMYESDWACAQGELESAERLALETFEVATKSGQPDAVVFFGAMLFRLRYQQGRAGELVETTVRLAGRSDTNAAYRAGAALALIESGQVEQAVELAIAEDFRAIPRDWNWSWAMFIWADVCARLGRSDRAEEIFELMAPFSGLLAVTGPHAAGSVDWALGRLATTLERYEQAEEHFAAAAELEARLGAPLLLARTQAGWARALLGSGGHEELERSQQMLAEAERTAARLGGALVAREVAECRAAAEAGRASPPPASERSS